MKRTGLNQLTDIMENRADRPEKNVYFLRINAYSIQVEQLLRQVVERVRKLGVLIDGKLVAPDVRQITYYQEMIGDEFDLNISFIERAISKWLPRLTIDIVKILSNAIYTMLFDLKQIGKNINILKNAFIKYMCWLFYKFSQIVSHITDSLPPIILYSGEISIYELQMLSILHTIGCDIILLQIHGDQLYLQLDSNQKYSKELYVPGGTAFPEDYCIKSVINAVRSSVQRQMPSSPELSLNTPQKIQPIQKDIPQTQSMQPVSYGNVSQKTTDKKQVDFPPKIQNRTQARIDTQTSVPPLPASSRVESSGGPKPIDYGPEPQFKLLTNQWFTVGTPLKDILTLPAVRSQQSDVLCNAFYRLCGVPDLSTYENDLYQFYQQLNSSGRQVVIVENGLPNPTPEEISKIKRGNYRFVEDMIRDLMVNFTLGISQELAKYAVRAFGAIILEESKKDNTTIAKLASIAIYLLCWFRKWQGELFRGWKAPAVPCFIYFGNGSKERDVLFLRMLAYMPVDVLIIQPNLNDMCLIEDSRLKTEMSLESLELSTFPKNARIIHVATECYQAERDLDSMDMGVYRHQQFSKARVLPIQASLYEIEEIWHQEILERPNAEISQGVVNMPVLFSKISGVSQDKEEDYWLYVKKYLTPETILIPKLPFASLSSAAQGMADFYKNGKLLKEQIKTSRYYNYNLLRSDMQEHMLNCLQEILELKIIRNVAHVEQIIVATAMSLNRAICQRIQQFDFTRKSPKLIILHTTEALGTIQDAIQVAFLSRIGFDILIFAPTGYQCVEQWYNYPIVDEHQEGAYHYDYRIPDFKTLGEKQSWFSRLIH